MTELLNTDQLNPQMTTFPPAVVRVTEAARQQEGVRFTGYRIAAIVPCYNEAIAIDKVVRDLRAAVPDMDVYVYDNSSTDNTADVARRAGAIVRTENLKGKGNVVRRAFADVDADIYLMIDGDDTYDAAAAPALIQALLEGPYDHVLGVREPVAEAVEAYRPSHEMGNRVLNSVVANIFGDNVGDMLSGYRVFSRRFVKSFPASSREFEIETELTVHSLALRMPSTSVQVGFRDRAEGSESKLRTYRDGWKILSLILNLTRHERPTAFYGAIAGVVAVLGVASHFVVPILQTLLIGIAVVCLVAGFVLDGTRKARHESNRLAYLKYRSVEVDPELVLEEALSPSSLMRSLGSHAFPTSL